MPKYIAITSGCQPNRDMIAGTLITRSRKSARESLPKLGLADYRVMLFSSLTTTEQKIAESKPILIEEGMEATKLMPPKRQKKTRKIAIDIRLRLEPEEYRYLEDRRNRAGYLRALIARDMEDSKARE